MSAYDPTDELIRAMLARRADGAPPAWLLSSVVGRVPTTRQVGRGRGLGLPERSGPRLALVAAAVLLLAVLAGGFLLAGGLFERQESPGPTQPAAIVMPSALPTASADPGASPSDEAPAPTDRPASAETLAPDTLAVVTRKGYNLRVRSAPGTGANSDELSPLLQPGATMLVLRGPVARDGYDWYEVILDDEPGFGWVAAGQDGAAWIEPVDPDCPATLDQQAAVGMSRIELLTCFGKTPVSVRATWTGRGADTGSEPEPCPWTGGSVPCEATPGWLQEPLEIGLLTPDGESLSAAASPAVQRRLAEVPDVASMTLTLAMDHPKAASCRVQDRRGRNVVPRDQAVAMCRLRFVITDVAWDRALTLPQEDQLTRVLVEDLPVHRSIDGDRYGTAIPVGTELLVVAGPERDDRGTPWYGVIPRTGIGWPWGWVPFLDGDQPTLARTKVDCPAPGDWAEIVGLDLAARVACFASRPRMTFTARIEPIPAGPTGGLCSAYADLVDDTRPCDATPAWLGRETGYRAAVPDDESAAANIWFDPGRIDVAALPSLPTLMRVTGRFWHPASSECDVQDPGTGETLVWELAAWRSCAGQFVVTRLEPVP